MAGQELSLARLHPLGFLVLGVVPTEEVQDPVDDEQRHLVVEGHFVFEGVARRDGRTEHDVADELGNLGQGGFTGPAPAPVGHTAGGLGFTVDGKAQDVGGALLPHELLVEVGDRGLVSEDQRDLRESAHPLIREGPSRQDDPPLEVDLEVVLLVRGVDVDGHEERS